MEGTFKIWKLYEKKLKIIKFQNSEYVVLILDPKLGKPLWQNRTMIRKEVLSLRQTKSWIFSPETFSKACSGRLFWTMIQKAGFYFPLMKNGKYYF
jgi:hypothetical protein